MMSGQRFNQCNVGRSQMKLAPEVGSDAITAPRQEVPWFEVYDDVC
jgi:hypothetical protein